MLSLLPRLIVIYCSFVQWRIQKILVGGDFKHKTLSLEFKHKTSKIRMSNTEIETDFSAEIGHSNVFFRPKSGGLQKKKKKKVFTEIETDFSEIQTFFAPKIRWSPKKKKGLKGLHRDRD